MPRVSQIEQQREEFLPILAQTFSDLGYRRTTTAELARRCEVRENILYRIWDDKKSMFIAAIDYVYEFSTRVWKVQGTKNDGKFSIMDALDYESEHLGEFGYYRILFTGLGEAEDEDIRAALAKVYKSFHAFVKRQIEAHRGDQEASHQLDANLAAWALVGIGTVSTIGRETESIGPRNRRRLLREGGEFLAGPPGE